MKKALLILAVCVSPMAVVHADPLVVELTQKVEYLENQNKNLRGAVEELSHNVRVLTQKFDTFSSDVEMRLSTPGSTSPIAPPHAAAPAGPMPLMGAERPQPSILKDPGVAQAPTVLAPEATSAATPLAVTPVAAITEERQTLDPKQQYEHARSLLEQGDYTQAGEKFTKFIADHPGDFHESDAKYWLGVSYLVRGQQESAAGKPDEATRAFSSAAGAFAMVYKDHPKSRKAPDSLIKMAKSLSALGRKDNACTTLTQLKKAFPGKLEAQYQQDWAQLGCS